MLVRAHLHTQKTSGDSEERLAWKLRLVQGMQALGYSEDTILELFRLVDLMMTLPPELDQIFDTEVRRFGAENAMPYLTTIERFAIERGKLQNARDSVTEVLDGFQYTFRLLAHRHWYYHLLPQFSQHNPES